MSTIALTVTEFSRGLSDFLNQVQYQGQTLDSQLAVLTHACWRLSQKA